MITLIPTATPVTPTTLDRLPTEQALLRPVVDAAEETSDAFEAGEAIEISGYQAYLQQAGQHKILTAAEELQLAVRIQAGRLAEGQFTADALQARDELIRHNLKFAVYCAGKYAHTLEEREELTSAANHGLVIAAERFLAEKQVRFNTYASWAIYSLIMAEIGRRRVVDLPRNIREALKVLRRAAATLLQSEGREATDAELAAAMQEDEHKVASLRRLSQSNVTVMITGESGSGKSVTFLAAMGLLPKRAHVTGSVVLDGQELIGASPKLLRSVRGRLLSMIFQDPLSALNPVHRVGDQIVEMLKAHQKMSQKTAFAKAIELLDIVGIPQPDERAKQYPHEFSGGMRQRVVIAMAIANNPKVLVADEPTTALDVTVQAQILEVVQRVQQTFGTAVVLITHDLGVIARVADRVNVMYAGRNVEKGSVASLFEHPSHPYTRGLLASLPQEGIERLQPISGFPPNMLAPPPGCGFAPRCPHAQQACSEVLPPLRGFLDLETACIRAEELSTEGAN